MGWVYTQLELDLITVGFQDLDLPPTRKRGQIRQVRSSRVAVCCQSKY